MGRIGQGFRALATALALGLALSAASGAEAAEKVVRVGYQKYGNLILLKAKGDLETRLKPLGYSVTWTEFPSGPPLLEALNAGAIDIGQTGEAPPVFAQAAGAPLLYIANEPPAPRGEAILVPKDSPIRSLADLKGKRIALNKGSNVHFFLVKALEKAGIAYTDITTAFLAPADARAAFEKGSVDAWAIWDPYYAAGEAATGARVLTTAEGIAPNIQYYFASKPFADANAAVVPEVVSAIEGVDGWAAANLPAAAAQLSASIHVPEPVILTALQRQTYGVRPISAEAVASQQAIADTFLALGLIPKALRVADVVWKPGT